MTAILTLTVLVLIGIAIWQISKMFDLSQTERNTIKSPTTKTTTQGKLMFAFLVFIYYITLYSFYAWGDVLLPEAASEHGSRYDN